MFHHQQQSSSSTVARDFQEKPAHVTDNGKRKNKKKKNNNNNNKPKYDKFQDTTEKKDKEPIGILEKRALVVEGTTLYDVPVPYTGIHKEEEDEIKKIIKHEEKEYFLLNGDFKSLRYKYDMEYYDFIKLTGAYPGEHSIRVGPVLQVLSVVISHENGSSWDGFEIDGEITVSDYRNNVFSIYKCEADDPQWVTPELDHLFFEQCPIAPVLGGNLKFNLVKDRRDVIFDDSYDLDYSVDPVSTYSQEKTYFLKCDGHYGYSAVVEYAKIPFAFIAKAQLFCNTYGLEEGTTLEVYGTVKVQNIVCFDEEVSKPLKLKHGKMYSLGQSRILFPIPLLSPFVIEAKFFGGDRKLLFDGTQTFYPSHRELGSSESPVYFPCDDKTRCGRFGVYLEWILHDEFFGGRRLVDQLKNVKWTPEDLPIDLFCESLIAVTPDHLVEVFSILVGGGDSAAPLAICGTIIARDRGGTVYIFSRNDSCPDKLSEQQFGRTLSLAWPTDRWIKLEHFYMHFKLQDVQRRSVSRGSLHWRSDFDTYYDRRMCGIVRGKDGYFAAVHYTVFKNAKRATVSVTWIGPPALVFGCIVAGYIGHVYPSSYDEEYYRSIIFKKSEEYGVHVKYCSRITLSKSKVSAPSNCQGLIVHVNLPFYHMQSPYAGSSGKLVGELLFKADTNASQKLECIVAKEKLECILVMVDWE